jgi:hypothetical protein
MDLNCLNLRRILDAKSLGAGRGQRALKFSGRATLSIARDYSLLQIDQGVWILILPKTKLGHLVERHSNPNSDVGVDELAQEASVAMT